MLQMHILPQMKANGFEGDKFIGRDAKLRRPFAPAKQEKEQLKFRLNIISRLIDITD